MKLKDLPEKTIFTWWGSDHLHTGVKLGDGRAFCLDTLEIIALHANKDVKEPEPIPEDVILKFGRNGIAYLCEPGNTGRVLARRILLIGGEFMREDDLKTGTQPKTGESHEIDSQVYIILSLLMRKLKDLETVAKTVQLILDEKSECVPSDNRIMSTSAGERVFFPLSQ